MRINRILFGWISYLFHISNFILMSILIIFDLLLFWQFLNIIIFFLYIWWYIILTGRFFHFKPYFIFVIKFILRIKGHLRPRYTSIYLWNFLNYSRFFFWNNRDFLVCFQNMFISNSLFTVLGLINLNKFTIL